MWRVRTRQKICVSLVTVVFPVTFNYFVVVDKGAVRLVGCGSTWCCEGRLEVRLVDTWGTVCDDLFDNRDAQVACYSLGFR